MLRSVVNCQQPLYCRTVLSGVLFNSFVFLLCLWLPKHFCSISFFGHVPSVSAFSCYCIVSFHSNLGSFHTCALFSKKTCFAALKLHWLFCALHQRLQPIPSRVRSGRTGSLRFLAMKNSLSSCWRSEISHIRPSLLMF